MRLIKPPILCILLVSQNWAHEKKSKIQVFANEVLPSKHEKNHEIVINTHFIIYHILYHFVSNCHKMMGIGGIVLISFYFIGVFTSEAEAECDESKKCIMGASCHLR